MTGRFKKNQEKSRRKMLREEYEAQHPHHTEGILDEFLLENNSYYDIDMLNQANANTKKGIKYWEGRKANASSWIGKWAYQIKIDSLKKKLHTYENKS